MKNKKIPRLPLEGSIDLTYRCNNRCRHCWLWLGENSAEKKRELNFSQWKEIFDQARALGTREWVISGGEPMLHPDFIKVFDYLTTRSVTYTLNTNGTLITPEIAELMRRKGSKMVALYGADAEMHDHITREPGSFKKAMRGFSLLREAGAGFTVQVVPMRDSYHQLEKMKKLAESLSPSWRIGSAWLFHSACRSEAMNREIDNQRLTPRQVVDLDPPNPAYISKYKIQNAANSEDDENPDDRLLFKCVSTRNSFHIDPTGGMSNCLFVKDPFLRYDLKTGSFKEGWEVHIPSIGEKVLGGEEYRVNCGSCDNREICSWCPVYSWLEHGRYSAPLQYLCDIAEKKKMYISEWEEDHRRFYQVAGVTVQVDSDLPFKEDSYLPKFDLFRTESPGEDRILIRYHFEIPHINWDDMDELLFQTYPWAIYRKGKNWIYREILDYEENENPRRVVTANENHTLIEIYLKDPELFYGNPQRSLSLFPSDQLFLSRLFADRQGLLLHSSAMIINGAGLVFSGKSTAGKSTMATLLKNEGTLLCDENNIIRRWPDGFHVHGTWTHGTIPDVTNGEAPLKAILFLEKSENNEIEPLTNTGEILRRITPRLMQGLVTTDWWKKNLELLDMLLKEVPVYIIKFDKSGAIAKVVREFAEQLTRKKNERQ